MLVAVLPLVASPDLAFGVAGRLAPQVGAHALMRANGGRGVLMGGVSGTYAAKVVVLGWGSTYGPIGAGVRRVRKAGYHAAQVHLRHLNPFPANLGEVLHRPTFLPIPKFGPKLLLGGEHGGARVDRGPGDLVHAGPVGAAQLSRLLDAIAGRGEPH